MSSRSINQLSGICLGAALIFGREYFDRSVHDVRQLRDEFHLPVLGEVTRIQIARAAEAHEPN